MLATDDRAGRANIRARSRFSRIPKQGRRDPLVPATGGFQLCDLPFYSLCILRFPQDLGRTKKRMPLGRHGVLSRRPIARNIVYLRFDVSPRRR